MVSTKVITLSSCFLALNVFHLVNLTKLVTLVTHIRSKYVPYISNFDFFCQRKFQTVDQLSKYKYNYINVLIYVLAHKQDVSSLLMKLLKLGINLCYVWDILLRMGQVSIWCPNLKLRKK